MPQKSIPPMITNDESGIHKDAEVHTHPAFGVIRLTQTRSGQPTTLFGSDVGHHSFLKIEIAAASLTRSLSSDWIHGEKCLLRFEMSHAQFAQFITGAGNYDGTPITISNIGVDSIPSIVKKESKYDLHRKEISAAAKQHLEAVQSSIDKLVATVESGKFRKPEMRKIVEDLRREIEYIPGSLEYVLKSAEEALENATTDAKVEVESYIATSARSIGLKAISDLVAIDEKNKFFIK